MNGTNNGALALIKRAMGHSFDWKGCATRKEVWAFLAFALVLIALCAGAEHWLSGDRPGGLRLTYLVAAALFPAWVSLYIRRLHDLGRSGAWLLLSVVPLLSLLLVAYLLLAPSRQPYGGKGRSPTLLALGVTATALGTLLIASRLFWAPYFIPSGAMKPTLLIGDYLAVLRPFGFTPDRGDVVVFRQPSTGTDYIKRLIGVPGDTVEMRDGVLYLNGAQVPQEPAGTFDEVYEPQGSEGRPPSCANQPQTFGDTCESDRSIETLPNGKRYDVLSTGTTPQDNTGIYAVPPGHYFVLGDNRDNSLDSRFAPPGVDMLPAKNLIGRADRVIFSSAGPSLFAFWTWRADRFLKAIN